MDAGTSTSEGENSRCRLLVNSHLSCSGPCRRVPAGATLRLSPTSWTPEPCLTVCQLLAPRGSWAAVQDRFFAFRQHPTSRNRQRSLTHARGGRTPTVFHADDRRLQKNRRPDGVYRGLASLGCSRISTTCIMHLADTTDRAVPLLLKQLEHVSRAVDGNWQPLGRWCW